MRDKKRNKLIRNEQKNKQKQKMKWNERMSETFTNKLKCK